MKYKLRINVSIEQVNDDGSYAGGGGVSPFQGSIGHAHTAGSVREVLGVVADAEEALAAVVASYADPG